MTHQVKERELAGFELIGYRQPDGTIMLGIAPDQTPMNDFPNEVEIIGNTYELEYIKKNKDKFPDSGHDIEWGIYV